MPPQLQSLIVRALVLSIPRTLNWKTGMGTRTRSSWTKDWTTRAFPSQTFTPSNVLLVLQKLLMLSRTGEVGYCLSLGWTALDLNLVLTNRAGAFLDFSFGNSAFYVSPDKTSLGFQPPPTPIHSLMTGLPFLVLPQCQEQSHLFHSTICVPWPSHRAVSVLPHLPSCLPYVPSAASCQQSHLPPAPAVLPLPICLPGTMALHSVWGKEMGSIAR